MSEIHIGVLMKEMIKAQGLALKFSKKKKKKKTSSMQEGAISRNMNNKTMTVKIG